MKKDKSLTEKDYEELWSAFGDVPINDDDEIEQEFLWFPIGTDRFDVWHWFDENYPGGVATLTGIVYIISKQEKNNEYI